MADYEKIGWKAGQSGGTPMSASNLGKMDDGIAAANADATTARNTAAAANKATESKVAATADGNRVYGTDGSGEPKAYEVAAASAKGMTVPLRATGGQIYVNDPSNDKHAATKKYVDDAVPDVSGLAAKTEIPDVSGFVPKADYDALVARVAALEAAPAPETPPETQTDPAEG